MPAKKHSTPELTLDTNIAAILVGQGKILDFIDGKTQRDDNPEEYVRQEIAKSLVREYGFPKDHIAVEFTLALGSRKPRADLVIFGLGQSHKQEYARIIVECKAASVKSSDKKDGVGQLQSYMAASPNVTHGMWTNGLERICYRKVVSGGTTAFEEIPDIPAFGKDDEDADRPHFDGLKPASSDALLFAFRRATITLPETRASKSRMPFGNSSNSSSAKSTTNATRTRYSSMHQPRSATASTAHSRSRRGLNSSLPR